MHSMTGFGQAVAENARVRVTVTLRGVNHRFLDFNLRLTDEHRVLESTLRERAGAALFRGRVEAQVDVESLSVAPMMAEVDEQRLAAVRELIPRLREVMTTRPTFGDLLRVPDLIRFESGASVWEDGDTATAIEAFDGALAQLLTARRTEGTSLATVLESHVAAIAATTAQLDVHAERLPTALAETLHRRLSTLLADAEVDPARLAQEVAVMADRGDVREELDRLRSHVDHFRSLMGEEGAVGKRLDFLAQELLREFNTVGSKCRDAEMTRLVVEGKARCEQIREQVQNVE